ncbi:hypothetical protein MUK70_11835 [Dyadobacter chenwenxiniae]|uniref:Uncharacterized protein n=1 Tax=Dyadobacter chenwenxiniae TaxID=2906456 RepID=A0A9X1PEN7_9BACT|nr:hypothetical protein [Dyadobacter chenwenxiniae]MCF0059932.1 hypothetical protein [Dyadobacter chenwenxiniae]UON85671.1 hypothetical protein MUK70_11835 [Dyadobacter chenwenxiniae]
MVDENSIKSKREFLIKECDAKIGYKLNHHVQENVSIRVYLWEHYEKEVKIALINDRKAYFTLINGNSLCEFRFWPKYEVGWIYGVTDTLESAISMAYDTIRLTKMTEYYQKKNKNAGNIYTIKGSKISIQSNASTDC